MRDKEIKRLHQRLQEIHTEMQDPNKWHNYGICSMLGNPHLNARFYHMAKGWPHHSARPAFPVPAPEGSRATPAFMFMYNPAYYHWDRESSEYAELRWQLLEWLIEETKP